MPQQIITMLIMLILYVNNNDNNIKSNAMCIAIIIMIIIILMIIIATTRILIRVIRMALMMMVMHLWSQAETSRRDKHCSCLWPQCAADPSRTAKSVARTPTLWPDTGPPHRLTSQGRESDLRNRPPPAPDMQTHTAHIDSTQQGHYDENAICECVCNVCGIQ
jgi:hypothetical protein